MKCLHSLFHGCVRVETVNLKKVDVRSLESSERCLDSIEYCGTRQPGLIDVVSVLLELRVEVRANSGFIGDEAVALGQNKDFGAGD